jgi:hypothetical protein
MVRMYDTFTFTLIILTVVLLRWSLLTDPDASPRIRVDGVEKGFTTLAHMSVRADRPHPARCRRAKR